MSCLSPDTPDFLSGIRPPTGRLNREGWAGIRFPNGIALNLKSLAFGTEADVAELLDEAEVIEGGDAWDPDSDCWIP